VDEGPKALRFDPLATLRGSEGEALAYFVRRDLLGKRVGTVEDLWALPGAHKLVRKQQANGSWRYKGKGREERPYINYDLLETFRNLRELVESYGFTRAHPALERAAEYVFSCQTGEGDIRGILGNQFMPYYQGALMALLIRAGYEDDARIEKAFRWMLSVRQNDGGWIVPVQAIPPRKKTEALWRGTPLPPDRSRPFSHLATDMVLRAFAAHPRHCRSEEARRAGELLKSRFFRADKYNDRKAPAYWLKFQYPFWWANLLTALDSLSRLGFPRDDAGVNAGLAWFVDNQESDGLWPTGYGKGRKAVAMRLWVGLAVCRMFRQFQS
jgi:hypothetical protein